jgi:hypothetical protein
MFWPQARFRLRALVLGFALMLWASAAGAQTAPLPQPPPPATPPPAPPPPEGTSPPAATPESHESTRTTLNRIAQRQADLAKLLDPTEYGPAFEAGAQAEFLAPAAGVSSLVFGYDAVFMQIDADLGIGIGGDPIQNKPAADVYTFDLRLGFPVHRGVRADFSIVFGGGGSVVHPPHGGDYVLGDAIAGARMRVFQSPNVALTGTLGFAAVFRGDNSLVVLGAKPLGAASIVYFFR